jgi:hypothetical protein
MENGVKPSYLSHGHALPVVSNSWEWNGTLSNVDRHLAPLMRGGGRRNREFGRLTN